MAAQAYGCRCACPGVHGQRGEAEAEAAVADAIVAIECGAAAGHTAMPTKATAAFTEACRL